MADAPLASRFTAVFIGYSALVVVLLGLVSIWANEQLERTVHTGMIDNEIRYYSVVFSDPDINVAKNSNAMAWLHRTGENNEHIPKPLANLSLGMHEDFTALGSPDDVFVADTELGRMFIVLDGRLVDERETEFVYMLIGFSVFLLLLSALIAKFSSLWLTGPIRKLSNELSAFEPGCVGQRLSGDYHGPEVELLVNVIRNYQNRVEAFISREQKLTSLISHELRTPLAIISGSADVLQLRHDKSSADRPPIDRIKNSAKTMSADIEALLMLAREPAKSAQAELCSVATIIAGVVRNYSAQLTAKNITLTQSIDETVQLPVSLALFNMLISNLLRNAIQHSQANALHLELDSRHLSLADTGRGISGIDLATITHIGTQAPAAQGGSGLGLYIVDQICNRMDWTLSISSEENVGTEFLVEFDLGRAEHRA